MRYLVLSTLLLASFACNTPEDKKAPAHKDAIFGLAKPIRLNIDTTIIHLKDFFLDPSQVSAIAIGDKQLAMDTTAYTVEITNELSETMGALEVTHGNQAYTILLISSEKQYHPFLYTGSPDAASVAIAGSMNGWNASATPLTKTEAGWETTLILAPGMHQYQLEVDGERRIDETNPNKRDNGFGGENSFFILGNPDAEKPQLNANLNGTDGISLTTSAKGKILVLWEDQLLEHVSVDANTPHKIAIPEMASTLDRSHIRAWVYNEQAGEDVLIPLQNGAPVRSTNALNRSDLHRWSMYFLLIDRFADGDSTNNMPVEDPEILPIANHFGGDMAGLQEQVNAGYFDTLGLNTIWVSPITTNASGAWGLWDKGVRSRFSGYHGYWPVRSTEIDPHFGDDKVFRELLDDAHDRNMNLIVDYVANHVHENHPVYQQHPDWATDLYLPDGSMNTERWDEYRLTTWFDTFLPTLDLERPEVYEPMTDSALYWLKEFPIDGFRHDATKHIPEVFWRTLTFKAKQILESSDRPFYQVGETYGNPELISSYVSSGQLDGQFDFNYYDAMVDALAKDATGFGNLRRVLEESLKYYGQHHLMGNITGNQDRTRFISYADGSVDFAEDPKLAGWTREIANQGKEGFEKLQLLHALLFTSPGIPCLYYGDEIGMPGANDPDNRRQMEFENLNEDQLSVRETVATLAHLRDTRMSLLYGNSRILDASDDFLVLERSYLGENTALVLCKNPKGGSYTLSGDILAQMKLASDSDTLNFQGRGYAVLNR